MTREEIFEKLATLPRFEDDCDFSMTEEIELRTIIRDIGREEALKTALTPLIEDIKNGISHGLSEARDIMMILVQPQVV